MKVSNLSFYNLIESCRGDDKVGFRFSNESNDITFDDFYNDCFLAREIIEGIEAPNVVICEAESYEWIVLFYASQLAGKTTILLKPNSDRSEIQSVCSRYHAVLLRYNNKEVITRYTPEGSESKAVLPHISVVLFTSGTESESKGVALSAVGVLSSAFYALEVLKVYSNDIVIHTLPFYHAFGLAAEVVATLITKCTLCFGRGIGYLTKDIPYFSATVMYAVPSIISGIFNTHGNFSSLRKIIAGSASIGDELKRCVPDGIVLHCSYGLSECSP